MDIQQMVSQYPGIVSLLFTAYGIDKPVNYDTLSAAIVLYANSNGNPFLTDLLAAIDGNGYDDYDDDDYDEILGLGKKGKARRKEKRAARGGYSRVGALARKVGIAKNRPAKGQGEAALNSGDSKMTEGTEKSDQEPKGKIDLEGALNAAGGAVTGIAGIIHGLKGGGEGAGGGAGAGGGGDDDGDDEKKPWYKSTMGMVGIGVGALAIIGIIIAIVKSGGAKK